MSEASTAEQANGEEIINEMGLNFCNKQTDEQVAQYFILYSWFFWATVLWESKRLMRVKKAKADTPGIDTNHWLSQRLISLADSSKQTSLIMSREETETEKLRERGKA